MRPKGWGGLPPSRANDPLIADKVFIIDERMSGEELVTALCALIAAIDGRPPSKWPRRVRTQVTRALAVSQTRSSGGLLTNPMGIHIRPLSEALGRLSLIGGSGRSAARLQEVGITEESASAWNRFRDFLSEREKSRTGKTSRKGPALIAEYIWGLNPKVRKKTLKALGLRQAPTLDSLKRTVRNRQTVVQRKLKERKIR